MTQRSEPPIAEELPQSDEIPEPPPYRPDREMITFIERGQSKDGVEEK
ncbi:MAG: hypothetical protein M3353_03560 [Actinomycetota bacterium]|nr:hypothetical protein [Actinomycetota bacterium]